MIHVHQVAFLLYISNSAGFVVWVDRRTMWDFASAFSKNAN